MSPFTDVVRLVLGVMFLVGGWWLVTEGPVGAKRRRRGERARRKQTFFEQEYQKRKRAISRPDSDEL